MHGLQLVAPFHKSQGFALRVLIIDSHMLLGNLLEGVLLLNFPRKHHIEPQKALKGRV